MNDDLATLGEFGLIDAIMRNMPDTACARLGVGDDCAIIQVGDEQLLLSCDAFVEDVHFRRDWASAEDIGAKAAASALSDIAAMGGQPLCMLVSLSCPRDTCPDYVRALYDGIAQIARACGAGVVGGDTTASCSGIVLGVTVVGRPTAGRALCRHGAQPGDVVILTGYPGCAALGLRALESGDAAAPPSLVQAHLRPHPELAVGRVLAAAPGVTTLIDTSDGLVQDLGHLARRSGLRMCLRSESIPLHPDLLEYAVRLDMPPLEYALCGGEDYHLLFTVEPRWADELLDTLRTQFGGPISAIGVAAAGVPEVVVDDKVLPEGGFDHFR